MSKKNQGKKSGRGDEDTSEIQSSNNNTSYYRSTKRFVKKALFGASNRKRKKENKARKTSKNGASSTHSVTSSRNLKSLSRREIIERNSQECNDSNSDVGDSDSSSSSSSSSDGDNDFDGLFSTARMPNITQIFSPRNNVTTATAQDENMCKENGSSWEESLRPVLILCLVFFCGCTFGSYKCIKFQNYLWTVKDVSQALSMVLTILWSTASILQCKKKKNKQRANDAGVTSSKSVSIQQNDSSQTSSFENSSTSIELIKLHKSTDSITRTDEAYDKEKGVDMIRSRSDGKLLSTATESFDIEKDKHDNFDKEDDAKRENVDKDSTEKRTRKVEIDSEVQVRKVPTAVPSESSKSKLTSQALTTKALGDPDTTITSSTAKRKADSNFLSNSERLKEQHPDVSKLVILTERGSDKDQSRVVERVIPNSGTYPIDNEHMYGTMHLMLRTPDVDDPKECDKLQSNGSKGPTMAQRVSEHFRGKQRQFEFHFQFRFKKPPVGPLYIGFELDTPLKLGMIQRAFVKTILGVIRTLNPFLHYSFGNAEEKSGKYENTHLSFTLESGMDRIVISKKDDETPHLNQEFLLEESDASVRQRKRGVTKLNWNTEDTYTIATWNAYASYLQWKALNLPGIRPFSISNVTGEQPFRIAIYAIRGDEGSKFHYRKDMDMLLNLELFHKPTCSVHCAGKLYDEYFGSLSEKKSTRSNFTEGSIVTDTDDLGDEEESFFEDDELTEVDSDDESDTTFERDVDDTSILSEAVLAEKNSNLAPITPSRMTTSESTNVAEVVDSNAPDIFFDVSAWIETADRQIVKSGRRIISNTSNNNNNNSKKKKHVETGVLRAYAVRVTKIVTSDDSNAGSSNQKMSDDGENTPGSSFSWITCLRTASELKELVRSKKHLSLSSISSNKTASSGDDACTTTTAAGHAESVVAEKSQGVIRRETYSQGNITSTPSRSTLSPSTDSSDDTLQDDTNFVPSNAMVNELRTSPETTVLKGLHRSLSETDMTRSTRLLKQMIEEAEEDSSSESSSSSEEEEEEKIHEKASGNVQPLQPVFRSSMRRQHSSEDIMSSIDMDGYFHGSALDDDLEQDPGADMFQSIRLERKKEKKGVMDYTYGIARGTLKVGYKGTKGTLKVGYKGTKSAGKVLKRTVLPPSSSNHSSSLRSISPNRRSMMESTKTKSSSSSLGLPASSSKSTISPNKKRDTTKSPPKRPVPSTLLARKYSSRISSNAVSGSPSAAKLPRPDESMHMVRKALAELLQAVYKDGSSSSSSNNGRLKSILNTSLTKRTTLDCTFLKGDASSIGVSPTTKRNTHHKAKKKSNKSDSKLDYSSSTIDHNLSSAVLSDDGRSESSFDDGMSDISGNGASGGEYLQYSSLVARALWESHWREEWCGIYSQPTPRVDVYAPFSSEAAFSIALADICNIRCMDDDTTWDPNNGHANTTTSSSTTSSFLRGGAPMISQPLPGYPVLVLETVWRCHYFAFDSTDKRQDFHDALESLRLVQAYTETKRTTRGKQQGVDNTTIANTTNTTTTTTTTTNNTSSRSSSPSQQQPQQHQQQFSPSQYSWQSFYTSVISTHCSHGRGKWAPIASAKKVKRRTIFNKRRLPFDTVDPFLFDETTTLDINNMQQQQQRTEIQKRIASFVQSTLSMALSLDPEKLDCDKLLIFLDRTSQLQNIPLHVIDFKNGETKGGGGGNNEAFCIFINLFHCLLQHSLLLSAHGPPNRRSVGHFMRCSCYELGNDVFSLSEIESFVLRGKLSAGLGLKPPFVPPPPESAVAFRRYYAISGVDARVNFLLNYGTKSCLSWVPIYTPEDCIRQIDLYCSLFLEQECFVDVLKKRVTLPRVCQIFYRDFLLDGATSTISKSTSSSATGSTTGGSGGGGINSGETQLTKSGQACLQFCRSLLDDETRTKLTKLMNGGSTTTASTATGEKQSSGEEKKIKIKYQPSCCDFYSKLTSKQQTQDGSSRKNVNKKRRGSVSRKA